MIVLSKVPSSSNHQLLFLTTLRSELKGRSNPTLLMVFSVTYRSLSSTFIALAFSFTPSCKYCFYAPKLCHQIQHYQTISSWHSSWGVKVLNNKIKLVCSYKTPCSHLWFFPLDWGRSNWSNCGRQQSPGSTHVLDSHLLQSLATQCLGKLILFVHT